MNRLRHGSLTRAVMVQRLAQKLGQTPDRMGAVYDTVVETINKALAGGGMVLIEGFGGFGPLNFKAKVQRETFFHPAQTLVARINATTQREKVAQKPPAEDLPIRSEDRELITRWLETRRPINLRSTHEVLYGPKVERPLSETSRANQGRTLKTFARRLPVPLAKLGLTTVHDQDIISVDRAKQQVAEYAEGFKARSIERWNKKMPELAAHPEWMVPAWRTHAWIKLVKTGTMFYDWLEEQGTRPKGTNPFTDMRRFRPFKLKRFRPIVREWYNRLLSHPGVTVRERAIILLLANGLRKVEVTRLRLEHLDLANQQAVILGKGSSRGLDPRPKIRTVPLLPWTVQAIKAYLTERRDSTNPLVFFSNVGKAVIMSQIARIFTQVMERVFYTEADAKLRKEISPHSLRRYFVTESLRRGVQVDALMRATGHGSLQAMEPYIGMADSDTRAEFKRVGAQPWF